MAVNNQAGTQEVIFENRKRMHVFYQALYELHVYIITSIALVAPSTDK